MQSVSFTNEKPNCTYKTDSSTKYKNECYFISTNIKHFTFNKHVEDKRYLFWSWTRTNIVVCFDQNISDLGILTIIPGAPGGPIGPLSPDAPCYAKILLILKFRYQHIFSPVVILLVTNKLGKAINQSMQTTAKQ